MWLHFQPNNSTKSLENQRTFFLFNTILLPESTLFFILHQKQYRKKRPPLHIHLPIRGDMRTQSPNWFASVGFPFVNLSVLQLVIRALSISQQRPGPPSLQGSLWNWFTVTGLERRLLQGHMEAQLLDYHMPPTPNYFLKFVLDPNISLFYNKVICAMWIG